ncbi:hypothetical protein [Leptospira weilii]|uniref:hypothetical protein n=1 Tax=Leptospira weilii TaxID=28184 RepID=UPI001F1670FB|nr:hypothetical protein [Leptospira weilii]
MRTAFPEFSYHYLEYRSFTPRMLNSRTQRKTSGYFLFHFFRRVWSFFFIKSYVSNLECFLKKSTSEFLGKK